MSGVLIIAAVVIIGVVLSGALSGQNSGRNSVTRLQRQIGILQNARHNEHVDGLLVLLRRAECLHLSPAKYHAISDILDAFIKTNDITKTEAVKNKINGMLPSSREDTASYPPLQNPAPLAEQLERIEKTNTDIYKMRILISSMDPDRIDKTTRKDLNSLVKDVVAIVKNEDDPGVIKRTTAEFLEEMKALLGYDYANALLTKHTKPAENRSDQIPKGRRDKVSDTTKNTMASQPLTIKPSVVTPAEKQIQETTKINHPTVPSVSEKALPEKPVYANLQETISALTAAKAPLTDKKLNELIDKIILVLKEIPGTNQESVMQYSRYLVEMLHELVQKPAYMQMGASVIAENMLSVYQAVAENMNVNMRNAEKVVRTDLYMRSFSVD